MEYIKNITQEELELIPVGIRLSAGEYRDIAEFANRSKLQDYSSYLSDLVYQDKVIILDADLNVFSKVESVQYICNAYVKVVVDQETSRSYNNYYFLKDKVSIDKNSYSDKFFRGRLKSLEITSINTDVSIILTTGDGVELPGEILTKRQKLILQLDGDVSDARLRIITNNKAKVELFAEGWNNELTPRELQQFVNTWYSDEELWTSEEGIIVSFTNNSSNIEDPKIVDRCTLEIDDDKHKDYSNDDFYRIYKVTDNEYFVEMLESNRWSTWNPNRYYVRAKNIDYVKFNDETVDVRTVELNDYTDHEFDKDD